MEEKQRTVLEKIEAIAKKVGLSIHLSQETKIELAAKVAKEDGTMIYTDADEFAVGVNVYVEDGEGNPVAAPDGEHVLETGSVAVVADGILTEIKEKAEETSEEDMSQFVTKSDLADVLAGLRDIMQGTEANLSAVAEKFNLSIEANKVAEAKVKELTDKLAIAEQKLSETPAAPSVKKEVKKSEVALKSAKEVAAMSTSERIKYFSTNPEAMPSQTRK